jgi:two-component system sensor histidine kinase/response regulator
MSSSLKKKKIRILYLDDEENNLNSFKAAFRREYDIYLTSTSEEAFSILKSVKPHIIFSDQRMPVTTGVEFFNAVRQVFPDPVRILLTGYTDINDIIQAINKGHIYRYITKPWNEYEVRVAIENAYDLYQTRKNLSNKIVELEKTNHELNHFIYSASHDLRAPVASSLGLLRVAKYEVKDESSLEYFGKIDSTLQRLDALIHNIVDYYKNSRETSDLELVDLPKLIDSIIESLNSSSEEAKANVACEIDNDMRFISDPFRIRIILSHLISNAIKFKKPNQKQAEISIKIKIDLENAHITVEDKGIGILEKHLQKVFQMFFKSNGSEKSGSGIGLYIVKEALDKLEGDISVDSEKGEGTKFLLQIPNKV